MKEDRKVVKNQNVCIITINTILTLVEDWTFEAYFESRNEKLNKIFTQLSSARELLSEITDSIPITFPKGTILKVDRVHIVRGKKNKESVSFIVRHVPGYEDKYMRFFASIKDVNNIVADMELNYDKSIL